MDWNVTNLELSRMQFFNVPECKTLGMIQNQENFGMVQNVKYRRHGQC